MEIENKVIFVEEREKNVFRFEIPANAPMADAYQAMMVMLDRMLQMMKDHAEKYKPQDLDEKKEEAPVMEEMDG